MYFGPIYWFLFLFADGLDPQNGVPLIKKQAGCLVCQDASAHTFDLGTICGQNTEEFVMCPNTKLLVSLRQIAPDIVMEDVCEKYRVEESKLILKQSRDHLLGDGSFGVVYRATYNGKPVAAKVISHLFLKQQLQGVWSKLYCCDLDGTLDSLETQHAF